MITPSDILHLPYTPDLTENGIAYACRSLASMSDLRGTLKAERLRGIVAGMSVELGFRRFLTSQEVPFHVLGNTPFTHPLRYDVSLGGHRCILKSFLITRPSQVDLIQRDPAIVLQAAALIPIDKFAEEGHRPDDVYIFALAAAKAATSSGAVDSSQAAGQPSFFIHPLPNDWARPTTWQPLEQLVLKSECEASIGIEIGGLDGGREFVTDHLELPSRTRIPAIQEFHSLSYIHAARRPEARIGLHSPTREKVIVIQAHAWSNIWINGGEILLTGWLTHEEYRHRGTVLNAGMHTFQFDRTRVKNLLVPMGDLNPLGPLFERVRRWESEKRSTNLSHTKIDA